ncbi:MAG: glycoside hydrolase family 2 protein [Janthinobacterium lividum]
MNMVASLSPAPQRDRVALDGVWDFRLDREEAWRAIQVPGVWQAQFDDLRETLGVTWYRRNFTLPPRWRSGDATHQVVLGFGAVNYLADVYVNGRHVGHHEGGYLAFEVALAPELLWADNSLEVKVTLPSNDRAEFPDHPFQEIPHGKQSWYGPMGGIWQPVWLERRASEHLGQVALGSDLATGSVGVSVAVSEAASAAALVCSVVGTDGKAVARIRVECAGRLLVPVGLTVPKPAAWSPDHPVLYRLVVELVIGTTVRDSASRSFGFRTIATKNGQFLLNGQPFYMRCALDQDYYPEGLYTVPTLAYLEDQMVKAKALGLNTVRCHIKVPDPAYYDVCDRLGLLVWTEFPNFERFSERAAERARITAEGIIARDGHHPSIIAWTIINEDWGTRLTEDPDHRRWLVEQYDWLKRHDPSRLIVDNSACFPNFHVKTDIEDYHYYRGVPDRRGEWDNLTDRFAAREDWTFSPFGDAERRGDEPLVCSEFGVWGLPHPRDLRRGGTVDPWWFETGAQWGEGVAYPKGLEQRYRSFFLERAFGSFDAFINATQWYQFTGLKYQIEKLRSRPSIQGYVITELTDIYWEANGLMDMERNLRAFHLPFAEVNADVVLVPGFRRWGYWAGETLDFAPMLATGGGFVGRGAILEWTLEPLGLSGRVPVAALGANRVADIAGLAITVPALTAPVAAALRLVLRDSDGETLARNYEALSLYPPAPAATAALLWSDDAALRGRLVALGYAFADDATAAALTVTRGVDTTLVEAIRRGHRALVIVEDGESHWLRTDEPPSLMPVPYHMDQAFPGLFAQARDNTMYRGDWITAFSWLQRAGHFAHIPAHATNGPMFDLSFDRVVPHHVLVGMKPWEFEAHVAAGLVVGWGHRASAIVAERWFGRGKAVLTTFRLSSDAPGADPVATALLHALIAQSLSG